MNISSSHSKVDAIGSPQRAQRPVDSIKEVVCRGVVGWLYPLAFQHSPESFRYVEMRGIRRQEEKKESSLLPNLSHFLHKFAAMHLCIIQHDESLSLYREGKFIKEICYFFGCHAFHGCETMVVAPVVDHSPYVESLVSFRWDCHIFPWKLPSIRHVSFSACETSIPEKEVYESGVVLFYKLLQLLLLISVELRRGCPFGRLPYTSKSCAKADKKALNVSRHASLPVACCHLSLAFMTLSRSFSMACLTASSSDESIIGLAPCPGLFRRPSIPCSRYRLTQRLTLCSEHDSLSAIFFEGMPSALSNIIRLRFCINGLESKCSMYSNSTRCFLVSFTSVILIAVSYLGIMQKPCQHMYINF